MYLDRKIYKCIPVQSLADKDSRKYVLNIWLVFILQYIHHLISHISKNMDETYDMHDAGQ